MKPPTLIYDEAVMQTLLGLRIAERTRVMRALKQMKSAPPAESVYSLRDASGRMLSVLAVPPFLITYWLDGPVNELRIVDLQRVRY